MKKSILSVIVLTVICLVVSAVLAIINHFTSPIIEEAEAKEAYAACYELIPDAETFEEIDLSKTSDLPSMITNAYREKTGKGYVFKMSTTGFNSGLIIMCAISEDGKIINTKIVASNETPGYGKRLEDPNDQDAVKYVDSYIGNDSSLKGVDHLSGATRTSDAFKGAIVAAFKAFDLIAGGANNE